MRLEVRPVWVVQQISTGRFLHLELYTTKSLKNAGRAPTRECAIETGALNLPVGDYQVHKFYEEIEGSE